MVYEVYNLKMAGIVKFLDARKFGCSQPKIRSKRPNHWVISPKDAYEMANSVDPD